MLMSFCGITKRQMTKNIRNLLGSAMKRFLKIWKPYMHKGLHFQGIAARSIQMKNLKGVELMPYHKFGVAKDARIGRMEQKEYEVPSKEMKKDWEDQIRSMGGRIF